MAPEIVNAPVIMAILNQETTEEVIALIDRDPASISATGPGGTSPLYLAAYLEREDLVRELLLRNPPLDHTVVGGTGEEGFTALHIAAARGNRNIVVLLLEAGASKDVRNEADRTPAEEAALRGHQQSSRLIDKWEIKGD